MKAVTIKNKRLQLEEVPRPNPGPGEVLIAVKVAGVNRPDLLQKKGLYPPPKGASEIPGLEVAGVIEATGELVTAFSKGEEVCALVNGGGYAQYCAAPVKQVLPVPKGFSWGEAAAIPETFFTVWSNLFDRGKLRAHESVLIHGGGSGIGTTAIQLAHQMGCLVFITAGSDAKCRKCEELGVDYAINYRSEDFVKVVKEKTDDRGVDVILDMVGGDYVDRNLRSLALDGRLVNIAFLNGAKVEVDLLPVMLKRLTLTGSTLRPRTTEEKGAIASHLYNYVWPLLEGGKVCPVIDSTFSLEDAENAHRRMESNEHFGKIVLEVPKS